MSTLAESPATSVTMGCWTPAFRSKIAPGYSSRLVAYFAKDGSISLILFTAQLTASACRLSILLCNHQSVKTPSRSPRPSNLSKWEKGEKLDPGHLIFTYGFGLGLRI